MAVENSLLDYEINTGKIFTLMILRKLSNYPLFNNNTALYDYVLSTIENILKQEKIVTHKWENLTITDREFYVKQNGKWDTGFLNYRPYFEERTDEFIPAYDVIYYNSSCIITYEKHNEYHEFRLFFALKIAFTDVEKMNDFLNYQLKKNFHGNMKKYCEFLDDVLLGNPHIIEAGNIEKVKRYIKEHSSPKKIELDDKKKFEIPVKAYSPKQLQKAYEVSQKTFNSWINSHFDKVGELKGRTYTPQQVHIIFTIFGEPNMKP